MSSREIVLWLDERWYDALERHIKGKTLQEQPASVWKNTRGVP